MEIKFIFKGNCYSITIGHETPWFEQKPFILIYQEYYDDPEKPREISFARWIWDSGYKYE